MKLMNHFFGLALLTFVFQSCSLNHTLEDDLSKNFQQINGKIQVEVSETFVEGQLEKATYEVLFVESETGTTHLIETKENEIGNYLAQSGKLVEMNGKLLGEMIVPTSIKELEVQNSDSQYGYKKGGKGGGGGPNGGSGGSASVLVVLVSDATTVPLCTGPEMVEQLLGENNPNSVANFFSRSSKDAYTIGSVDVAEIYINEAKCGTGYYLSVADPVLLAQGVNVDNYDHIIYISDTPSCPYAGRAALGGKRVHLTYCSFAKITAHELGHNLGLMHSSRPGVEYGDGSCTMGGAYRELNAPHRHNLGWLPTTTIRKSGTYQLAPLEEDNPNENQIFKIKISRNNIYYLSYRAPIGVFDSGMSTSYVNRLSVHTWAGPNLFTILQGAPDTNETYTNLADGIEFTNLGIQNGVLTVQINFL